MYGRRSLLVGLAIGILLPAAEAQENASAIDADLVTQTRAISALSLLASREGMSRLHIPQIKAFANAEAVEQETTWTVLRSMTGGAAEDNSAPPSSSSNRDGWSRPSRTIRFWSRLTTAREWSFRSIQTWANNRVVTVFANM
jgi:hypothetical protein